jgi:hypothetical protein
MARRMGTVSSNSAKYGEKAAQSGLLVVSQPHSVVCGPFMLNQKATFRQRPVAGLKSSNTLLQVCVPALFWQ